ncbi:MAG: Asp-tRNA(Asn)/Glu-tRNA(Gln) amidotransferase subunit GatB [Proteobacteria bacterium]|nr:Asp-tRNA(Asn)/Glu-tRNA(Gln) amidotransferase subunit GatB [Pseudomonadota bacterium]
MLPPSESTIGLEVHAQLLSRSKLFCPCSTEYGAPPNTQVCPVCLGLPGALPVANSAAVEMAVRAALALGCEVRETSYFARKNYFYPDLAKGYQISQYELPLNERGKLAIPGEGGAGGDTIVGITRIHLEEDAAKNLHGVGEAKQTLVDFNRAGVPLIEIVSEPDMASAGQAEAYLRCLRELLMYVGVNDGNLEQGSFRCDANVSIRPAGQHELGTRVELKNINSFRFVRHAIEYEIARQQALIAGGGRVVLETRGWDEAAGKTVPMRGKEEAQDYRYFPDPDLPPLVIGEAQVAALRESLPELPRAKRERWQQQLGLTAYDTTVLTSHPRLADFYERAVRALSHASPNHPQREAGKKMANFMHSEVMRHVRAHGLDAEFPVRPEALAELLESIDSGTLSGKMAKEVFAEMTRTGQGAHSIIEARGLAQLSDAGEIDAVARDVLAAHPSQVEQYQRGKTNLLGFFVGRVMRATCGRANPVLVNDILRKRLGS